jgi:tetratricopeptide (TPR) repeat protein
MHRFFYRTGNLKQLILALFLLALLGAPGQAQQPSGNAKAVEFYKLGTACADADTDCQIKNFTKAIELNPKYASAYYARAWAYDSAEKYEKAAADYTRTIELRPGDENAFLGRGRDYYYLKKYDLSLADYTKCIEINPKNADAFYNRGLTYYDLEKYDESIADYSRAIAIDPVEFDYYYNRALAYE